MRLLMMSSTARTRSAPTRGAAIMTGTDATVPGKAEEGHERDCQLCTSRYAQEITVGQRIPEGRLHEEPGTIRATRRPEHRDLCARVSA